MTKISGHNVFRTTTLAATLAVAALSLAAAGQPAGAAGKSLAFEPIAFPMSVAEKSDFIASASVTIDGKSYPIGYNMLLRAGDKLGGVMFGQLVDINGKPMVKKDGSPDLCDKPDFMSLIQAGSKIFMINQFECRPAAMYLTELSQDAATGALTSVKSGTTRPLAICRRP